MLSPVGATLARLSIDNDEDGFARAVAWIAEHAPGARMLVGLEGTRSYGIALARALTRAGLTVVEVERPKREQRRGRGKSDPIDAHLAAPCQVSPRSIGAASTAPQGHRAADFSSRARSTM
jgi:transposase